MKFHRKYNHFSTWPPKYSILLKYAKIIKFHNFCWNFTKKSSKVRKWRFFKIWADFDDSRADFPLQNLCISLGFSWSGLVSCVPWSAGTDFCIFSSIYWKCWNLHKIMEFLKISEKFKNFSEFSDFCIFRAVDPPKPLINDKEYWCFCKPVDFAEIMIFGKKS